MKHHLASDALAGAMTVLAVIASYELMRRVTGSHALNPRGKQAATLIIGLITGFVILAIWTAG